MKLIKFGAEWCGPCRSLDAKLKEFTACEVVKYDVDDEAASDLVDKFKIRSVPVTFLVDDNENIVHKWVGDFNLNEVTELLK